MVQYAVDRGDDNRLVALKEPLNRNRHVSPPLPPLPPPPPPPPIGTGSLLPPPQPTNYSRSLLAVARAKMASSSAALDARFSNWQRNRRGEWAQSLEHTRQELAVARLVVAAESAFETESRARHLLSLPTACYLHNKGSGAAVLAYKPLQEMDWWKRRTDCEWWGIAKQLLAATRLLASFGVYQGDLVHIESEDAWNRLNAMARGPPGSDAADAVARAEMASVLLVNVMVDPQVRALERITTLRVVNNRNVN